MERDLSSGISLRSCMSPMRAMPAEVLETQRKAALSEKAAGKAGALEDRGGNGDDGSGVYVEFLPVEWFSGVSEMCVHTCVFVLR